MTAIFTESMKTGDIVTKFPGASKLFKQYKIDFCCGGNRPIGEVLQEKQLDTKEILDSINTMYQVYNQEDEIDWTTSSLKNLMDHINEKYHQSTREMLDELSAFVTKVYRVHGQRDSHLKAVYDNFFLLKKDLEQHLQDEEISIFPYIAAYEQTLADEDLKKAKAEIDHLESEHEEAGEYLKNIRSATNDFEIPEGACNTYRLTYLKLEELESMTFDHIHLENNILFKRI
ncbi:iron-sulfur cluster repair di-iron protein [Niallia nealsonii]|uniref:Iron-sulfur cluster repair di-iron protein n=1 Tax=Niallia nealsonii TaxID=115979 RepID=A0A2N0YXJ9_9BACI|nr:iron-sulfur cluster repair di-iron protein [Niallia nealsonii]PKG21980.1 iron-sulfur cluster repair di-iron protein [Niallia nealsonii]